MDSRADPDSKARLSHGTIEGQSRTWLFPGPLKEFQLLEQPLVPLPDFLLGHRRGIGIEPFTRFHSQLSFLALIFQAPEGRSWRRSGRERDSGPAGRKYPGPRSRWFPGAQGWRGENRTRLLPRCRCLRPWQPRFRGSRGPRGKGPAADD